MNAYRQKPLSFPWPPIFYASAILVAWLLERLAPLGMSAADRMWLPLAGTGLVLVGLGLDVWAIATLYRNHTTAMPNRMASRLVTCGPFRLSRNPTYLGYTLATIGIGLMLGNGWIVAAALVSAMITYGVAIRREEWHLHARFGYEFERYRRQTRTWI